MRCKNCGTENDDNRYICENCGSPLYDEESISSDNERTQTFKAINTQNGRKKEAEGQRDFKTDFNDNGYAENEPHNQNGGSSDKKNIIVIAILIVILVAIIASIIAIAGGRRENKNLENSSSELTKISSVSSTERTTEKESTTEEETEKTTEKTTTAQTLWIINTSSSGGGETEGDGKYKNGDKVTLVANADDGYEFDGWYSNGIKVSNKAKYTFTANENASFSAVFNPVQTTTSPEEITNETADNSSTPNVVFGE